VHSVTISNLQPGTTYHFVAESTGVSNGVTNDSPDKTFTTSGGTTPPPPPPGTESHAYANSCTEPHTHADPHTEPVSQLRPDLKLLRNRISATSVTVTFTTSASVRSQVFYGANGSLTQSDAMTTTPSTTHVHTIGNLIPNTIYGFSAATQ
jgi:hypothetical protein